MKAGGLAKLERKNNAIYAGGVAVEAGSSCNFEISVDFC